MNYELALYLSILISLESIYFASVTLNCGGCVALSVTTLGPDIRAS